MPSRLQVHQIRDPVDRLVPVLRRNASGLDKFAHGGMLAVIAGYQLEIFPLDPCQLAKPVDFFDHGPVLPTTTCAAERPTHVPFGTCGVSDNPVRLPESSVWVAGIRAGGRLRTE